MKGIVVLDGPDGAGKTTLAEHLVKHHGAHYMHLTYRHKNRMFDYHTAAIHRAGKMAQERLVVIDRWWMSELAYANAYRNGSQWPLMWRMMQRVLLKYSGVYVYCLPVDTRKHLDAYESLKESRPEMYRDILPATVEYHKLWDKVREWPNIIRYDRFSSDGEDLGFFTKRLFKVMEPLQADQPAICSDPKNYNLLGHLGLARWLFVGESTNQRKKKGTWWPFYEYGASSLHLTKLLDELGFEEHMGLWCNAEGDPEMARYLLDRYDLEPICLGGEAYLHVTERRAEMYSRRGQPNCVLHPAYDKRFPLKNKSTELKWQLGHIIHGHRSPSMIYRDNVCISCWNEILSDDKREEVAQRVGIILPRDRRM